MRTPQLYDPGEEEWEKKLHVGCGSVYLEGYINADIAGLHPYEAPELLEANRTMVQDYYGCKSADESTMELLPPGPGTVVDLIADMRELPYVNALDKILCIQAFEHLTMTDANRAMLSWWNALKTGGILIISVPDPVATTELLCSEERGVREFAIRHLMGSGANTYSLHHWAYTEKNLRQLLTGYGFVDIERLPNIHFYPAIVLRAKKADPHVRDRSYQPLPQLRRHWKILDIGPGDFPLPQATEFADVNDEKVAKLGEKPLQIVNLDEKLPFADDSYDFVYCSHVLEHLERPIFALEEIQRVGKAGYVELPSVLLDFIAHHGKTHPKWACWGSGQCLLFIEKTEEQNRLFLDFGSCWGAFFHHALHGLKLSAPQRAIRFHFWENQHLFNIGAGWDKQKGLFVEGVELRLG